MGTESAVTKDQAREWVIYTNPGFKYVSTVEGTKREAWEALDHHGLETHDCVSLDTWEEWKAEKEDEAGLEHTEIIGKALAVVWSQLKKIEIEAGGTTAVDYYLKSARKAHGDLEAANDTLDALTA